MASTIPTITTNSDGTNSTFDSNSAIKTNLDGITALQNSGVANGVKAFYTNNDANVYFQKQMSQLGGAPLDNKTFEAMKATNSGDEAFDILKKSDWFTKTFPSFQKFATNHPQATLADYKNTQFAYKDILVNAGLDPSLANTDKVGKLMNNNINTTDFKYRVDQAALAANNQDPATAATLQKYYGITQSHMAEFFLDPKNSLPKLQNMVQASQIGGIADKSGLSISLTYAQTLAQDAAKGGYLRPSAINTAIRGTGATKAGLENIAAQSGKKISNEDLISGTLDIGSAQGIAAAQAKASEAAKFSGSNAGTQSLSKDVSGNY